MVIETVCLGLWLWSLELSALAYGYGPTDSLPWSVSTIFETGCLGPLLWSLRLPSSIWNYMAFESGSVSSILTVSSLTLLLGCLF